MSDAAGQLALLRFSGDITIKARGTRFQFVRRLLSNLRDALESEGAPPRIQLSHNRMLIEVPQESVLPALARVFGAMAPVAYLASVQLSALLWAAAFALYAVRYWPVLTRTRLDGRPG